MDSEDVESQPERFAGLAAGVAAVAASHGLIPLPITMRHAQAAAERPPHHEDPMDRCLTGQALAEHMSIVTIDGSQQVVARSKCGEAVLLFRRHGPEPRIKSFRHQPMTAQTSYPRFQTRRLVQTVLSWSNITMTGPVCLLGFT
jgi:hypothetical protein